MWPFWKKWINLNPEYIQSQGRDLVFENLLALRRPLCCHMEANWMIKASIFKVFFYCEIFQDIFKGKQEKRRKRRRGRRKRWLSLPSGKELEIFIQRNFLPINVSVHPDQNLQRVIILNPSTFHYFYQRNGGCLYCKYFHISRAMMLSARRCYYVPLPPSLVYKTLSGESWMLGMD